MILFVLRRTLYRERGKPHITDNLPKSIDYRVYCNHKNNVYYLARYSNKKYEYTHNPPGPRRVARNVEGWKFSKMFVLIDKS